MTNQDGSHKQFLEHLAQHQSSHRDPAEQVWVLVGSSGGLAAVRRFFRLVPPDLPVAFILAFHIAAAGRPLLLNLMGKSARLRVYPAVPGHLLCGGDLLVEASDADLSIDAEGRLQAAAQASAVSAGMPTDRLLAAVARRYRGRAGVIVFSGIGSDGVKGCRCIQDAGGQVWVQDAASCLYTSLPRFVRHCCDVSFSARPEILAQSLVSRCVASDPRPERVAHH